MSLEGKAPDAQEPDEYEDEFDKSGEVSKDGDVNRQWSKWKEEEKLENDKLSASKLGEFISSLGLIMDEHQLNVVDHFVGSRKYLTLSEAVALVHMLTEAPASPMTDQRNSARASQASPLKQILNAVLESGTLAYDDTVVKYMSKLDEHRKKCEADGRYSEAKAAATRLADLRTAQVARMRQEILAVQTRELSEVQRVYEEETKAFNEDWEARIEEYGRGVKAAQKEMRAAHTEQQLQLTEDMVMKQPKPRPTPEYLNSKKIEESLAKAGEYTRAQEVKLTSDSMVLQHMEQALANLEIEHRAKLNRLEIKQKQDIDAFNRRCEKGISELELKRNAESERRMNRFRNVVVELESLHRLEIVSLENFLDGQVLAGKAVPLKDAFRRKREQIIFREGF